MGHTTITSTKVPENRRLSVFGRLFGQKTVTVEAAIYDWMRRLTKDYEGGYWDFYQLSNGGFFMATDDYVGKHESGKFLMVSPNQSSELVDAKEAGLIVTLFAYSHLSFREGEGFEMCIEQHNKLLDYLHELPDESARKIRAIID